MTVVSTPINDLIKIVVRAGEITGSYGRTRGHPERVDAATRAIAGEQNCLARNLNVNFFTRKLHAVTLSGILLTFCTVAAIRFPKAQTWPCNDSYLSFCSF
jgi:hypothetical protein